MLTAELISIGDELLIGQVINTNVAFISTQLNALGIDVARITTIGDSEEGIRETIDRAWKEHDIVIATGGLGPTHDDISKKVVAKYFKKPIYLHTSTLARVKARFKKFGYKTMPVSNYTQAEVPKDFLVLPNDKGTAPGLAFYHKKKTFVILPGVPQEMKFLIEKKVIPLLKQQYKRKLGEAIMHQTLLTSGIGESLLAEKIGPMEPILEAGATLAFLPRMGGVRLRISVRANNTAAAKRTIAQVEKKIRTKVGSYIYGVNEESLEEIINTLLTQRRETVSAAESCTGGKLSMKITSIPGSSAVFPGSVISYSNDIKTEELGISPTILKNYSAVSEECAIAMAEGIRKKFGTTYSLSITGIAGPDGGSPAKPVGTVWIALATAHHTIAKLFRFGGEREDIRERSADAALELLRRYLVGLVE